MARQFVELMYGWNSSTVHQDVAAAVAMCSPTMAKQFREELAAAQFIEAVRRRNIRSEVVFDEVTTLEHGRRYSRVTVRGKVQLFPLTQYEGAPTEVRPFELVLVMAAVPRDPDTRPNGLEVVRIVQSDGANEELRAHD